MDDILIEMQKKFPNLTARIRLAPSAVHRFADNVLPNLGFEVTHNREMQGKTGMRHRFASVGIRSGNVVLVETGPRLPDEDSESDQNDRMPQLDNWVQTALLRMFDVASVLETNGVSVDMLVFDDVFHYPSKLEWDKLRWIDQYDIAIDQFEFILSKDLIKSVPQQTVRSLSNYVGAAFVGLHDLEFEEIALLTGQPHSSKHDSILSILKKVID
jgi:hypothetical protein